MKGGRGGLSNHLLLHFLSCLLCHCGIFGTVFPHSLRWAITVISDKDVRFSSCYIGNIFLYFQTAQLQLQFNYYKYLSGGEKGYSLFKTLYLWRWKNNRITWSLGPAKLIPLGSNHDVCRAVRSILQTPELVVHFPVPPSPGHISKCTWRRGWTLNRWYLKGGSLSLLRWLSVQVL